MARQPKLDADVPRTLAGIVELAFTRTGVTSSRRLEDYAHRHDQEISHGTINLIRKGSYPSRPKDSTLKALAFLSGVPINEVRRAAELPPRPAISFADQLPPDVDDLPPRARTALLELARVMLDMQRRHGDSDANHDSGVSIASLADLGLSGEHLNSSNPTETRLREG